MRRGGIIDGERRNNRALAPRQNNNRIQLSKL